MPVTRVSLSESLSQLIADYHFAQQTPLPDVDLANVVGLEVQGSTPQSYSSLNSKISRSGSRLQLEVEVDLEREDDLDLTAWLAKQVVLLKLADGSEASADAYLTGTSKTFGPGRAVSTSRLHLSHLNWTSQRQPVAWVGKLEGISMGAHLNNLRISEGGRNSQTALRLEGAHTWYLVCPTPNGSDQPACTVVIDAANVERDRLWEDFAALEFVVGRPLHLQSVVGVDASRRAVTKFELDFGYRFGPSSGHAPPMPIDPTAWWIPVAFSRVAEALRKPQPSAAMIGVCGYLDSLGGHIDGRYLFAQVALEAAASLLQNAPGEVVKDRLAWKAWVKSLAPAVRELAVDEAAAGVLLGKLHGASRPPTSSTVKKALADLGVNAPEDLLREVVGRNGVAHQFSMNAHGPYEFERDLARVDKVRVLLAALVLRHVGYDGELLGVEVDDETGHRLPASWFPSSTHARQDSRVLYTADSGMRGAT